MLSQFTKEQEGDLTLADLGFPFPSDAYPLGRLDKDSEGLLLLSNDKGLVDKTLNPKTKEPKTYWVQVENIPTEQAMHSLRNGITIKVNGKEYHTQKAKAEFLDKIPSFPERNPPIRYRANIPTTWISITLVEGKNRQIRRMTAAVGFPTLRLVRVAIGQWQLGHMAPGEVREV